MIRITVGAGIAVAGVAIAGITISAGVAFLPSRRWWWALVVECSPRNIVAFLNKTVSPVIHQRRLRAGTRCEVMARTSARPVVGELDVDSHARRDNSTPHI